MVKKAQPPVKKECTCISKNSAALIERIKAGHKENNFKLISSRFDHESIFPNHRIYMPFKYQYTFTKKDGSTSRTTTKHVNVMFTYCPFCGGKFPKS